MVCVIRLSNSFHSFIFKLCIMIVHTLKMHIAPSILCMFHESILIFGAPELRHFFHKMLVLCLVCVIWNSNSFQEECLT